MANNDKENLKEILEEIHQLSARLRELEDKVVSILSAPEPVDDDEPVDMSMEAIGDFEVDIEPVGELAEPPVGEPVEPEPVVAEPEPVEAEPEPALRRQPSSPASLPWKRDTVGIRVKNIRSAISLMDRALFINTLFKQDVALYDKTIAELNTLEDFNDAVVYVEDHFPDWNLSSDPVYSFMMSVRKKLG